MTTRGIPTDQYLAFAVAVCREAGEIPREARASGNTSIVGKGGMEIVTDADLAVDRHLRRRIAEA
jgi:fructose-1,6-bisphosphatase/inositol monophosphatase family enzyme